MTRINRACKILRGAALVLAGIIIFQMSVGCENQGKADVPKENEKIIYSDLNYSMVQGEAVHKPGSSDDTEYVFIPLTLKNSSDYNIIFSSEVCIKARALPSGTECSHTDKSAVAAAKDSIDDFKLFDGIIRCHEDTVGWLVFEVPLKTESVYIDFYTGYNANEYISFTCKL
jgi:hypothetical protein